MSLPMIATAIQKAFTAISSYGSLISSGLSVGSAALSYQQQTAQANAIEAQNAAANDRARMNMIADYDNMSRMEQQEAAAASQRMQENQINAAQTAATAQVAAGQSGVSGLSVDALLGDIFGQEASIRDSVNQNLENTGMQMREERASIARGYDNAVNTRSQPSRPSLFGTVLEAGTGVVGAYKDTWKLNRGTGRDYS